MITNLWNAKYQIWSCIITIFFKILYLNSLWATYLIIKTKSKTILPLLFSFILNTAHILYFCGEKDITCIFNWTWGYTENLNLQDMARPHVLCVCIRLLRRLYLGPSISWGLTNFPKSASETSPSFNAASFSVVSSLCAVFAIVAACNSGRLLFYYIFLHNGLVRH